MKTTPFKKARIDQDMYDLYSNIAKNQPGYVSATEMINRALRLLANNPKLLEKLNDTRIVEDL